MGAPLPVNGGGILLQGHLGQDVRAACAGRVVYAGTGIRGYGNLIIIKHSENLLSAYAHNRESLVREGQEIALGQLIGKMGEGAPQKPALYFEIRREGKPVDPLRYLPQAK
jgi:lipoprotein NlpD